MKEDNWYLADKQAARVPSKINEVYWELVDFIWPLLKKGAKAREIARLANRAGLRTRKGKRLGAAYIDSQMYYYQMRDHDTLEAVYKAHADQKAKKLAARLGNPAPPVSSYVEPKQTMNIPKEREELLRSVLDSQLPAGVKNDRIKYILDGVITSPAQVTAIVVDNELLLERINITEQMVGESLVIDRVQAKMLLETLDDVKNFAATGAVA